MRATRLTHWCCRCDCDEEAGEKQQLRHPSGSATRSRLETPPNFSFLLPPSSSEHFLKSLEALVKKDFSVLVGALSEEKDE